MLRRLLRKALAREEPQEAVSLRAPRPLFAVGDVHGMADMLDKMIEIIRDQIVQDNLHDAAVIFLGDYVDRGPHSKQAIDLLLESPARLGVDTVFIRGNHEEFARRFLDKPYEESHWLDWGGEATVESYDIDPQDFKEGVQGQIALSRALADAMGESHTSFLREGLVTHHNEWPFFFCHAGIDRKHPPHNQPERGLVHGVRGFREAGGWPDSIVVHGHYITSSPDPGPRRIGVDTGAYRSGVLTAAFCIGETIDFIEVEED